MEYLFKTKQFTEPSEEQLKKFYNKHISDYSKIKSLNLYTIKLDREGNYKVLKKLSMIADLTPLAKKYERLTPDIIEKKFGKYIALKLYELPQGLWSEPFNNTIFFITKKEVLHPYPFEEIEGIVYENYKKTLAVEYAQKEYAKIYNKYKIIEPGK
ncbi:MAG: peptidyl-prolyl cis-trans isomerase [Epsilonproteobacteria bacterium]|nr:peptidyl-prolyl cis-trans isomerase [Campylobacterota bacterium]